MRRLPERLMSRSSSSSGVDPVANRAAVARQRRRLVDERRFELLPHVGEVVEPGSQAADERRAQLADEEPHARHRGERLAQRDQIPRAGGAERRAGDQPLHVVDGAQRVLHLRPLGAAEGELLDGVEAILDALQRQQRLEQPGAQQPPAHRRHRAIDLVQQRPGAATVGRLDHVEVPERRRIDDQVVGAGAVGNLADVREIDLLGVAQVLDQRAGGADRGVVAFEPEAEQALRLQLGEQRTPCGLAVERPRLDRGDRCRKPQGLDHRRRVGEIRRRDDFARPQHRQLVEERLPRIGSRVFGGRELAGRQIQQRGAVARTWRDRCDGHQERRLARVEVAGIGQRAGRDHAHHFTADDSLGLLGILHLLADGDAKALAHQPRHVGIAGVMRHAAHRDGAAAGVLRARRQRELEGARRGERVLVEHLVEIAHPEEQDRVAILTLGFEELPHGRRRAGGSEGSRRHGRAVEQRGISVAHDATALARPARDRRGLWRSPGV